MLRLSNTACLREACGLASASTSTYRSTRTTPIALALTASPSVGNILTSQSSASWCTRPILGQGCESVCYLSTSASVEHGSTRKEKFRAKSWRKRQAAEKASEARSKNGDSSALPSSSKEPKVPEADQTTLKDVTNNKTSDSSAYTVEDRPAKTRETNSSTPEVVVGWGPDRLRVMSEDTFTSYRSGSNNVPSSIAVEGSHTRNAPPHMAQEPTTKLLTREESQEARSIGEGSYLSDKEWQSQDEEERKEGAAFIKTGGKLRHQDIPFEPIAPLREMRVASLAHGLDKVLFNPGVHRLKDPRSGVFNFPSTLEDIPDVDLFDFKALPPYITSSQDEELREIAKRERARFCGSTSTLTSMLSQVYFLISGWKLPSLKDFSDDFANQPKGFSTAAKLPALISLKPQRSKDADGQTRTYYAIDQDKSRTMELANSNYILTQLGKAMEKMLTTAPDEFSKYLRVNRPSGPGDQNFAREAYHYVRAGSSFVMRSQLDCHDQRLPGTHFDLKTRAVVSVRHDRANWVEASGYQITKLLGVLESFEREKYDMSRSAWLKYYFQAKIGCMDGIFVAYHNAVEVFGFEYFPVDEMAKRLFDSVELGDQAFKLSVALSEKILERVTEVYPDRPLSIVLETKELPSARFNHQGAEVTPTTMSVWVEPTDSKEEGQTTEQQEGRPTKKKITQFDVSVDRYMWDCLIQGPVDFSNLEHKGARNDEMPQRPLDLEIEYAIRPCSDLSEKSAYENRDKALQRQKTMTALVLPNIKTVNEREERLRAQLSKNKEALRQYKEDKKKGIAAGLPRAPGQVDLFRLDDEGVLDAPDPQDPPEVTSEAGEDKDGGKSDENPPSDRGEGLWKPAGKRILRLRELAQKGAEQRGLSQQGRMKE